MLPTESLFTFMITSVLLGIAPGPDNIFVLTQSALHGRKMGIFVTLGLCTGLITHTIAVSLGVAAIFQASAQAFTLLKTVGALYLTYLAWQSFRASSFRLEDKISNQVSASQFYRRGIIMNITNPKVSIFFLAFLPQFTSSNDESAALQMMMLGIVFILATLVVFSVIAMVAGSLGRSLNKSPKAQVYLNRIAGTVFLGLALKLATVSAGR